jgi:hypothetical protein
LLSIEIQIRRFEMAFRKPGQPIQWSPGPVTVRQKQDPIDPFATIWVVEKNGLMQDARETRAQALELAPGYCAPGDAVTVVELPARKARSW